MKPGSDKASPAELLQCITIYHVHLLVSTELRGLTFPHLCFQKIFFFSPVVCVCPCMCVLQEFDHSVNEQISENVL